MGMGGLKSEGKTEDGKEGRGQGVKWKGQEVCGCLGDR